MKCAFYFLDYEYDDEMGLHPVHLCWTYKSVVECPHLGDRDKCQYARFRFERTH